MSVANTGHIVLLYSQNLNEYYYNWDCEEEDAEMFKHDNWMLMDTVKKDARLLLTFMEQLHTVDCHFRACFSGPDW